MIVSDQSDVVSFIEDILKQRGWNLETIATHASLVFLAGDRAYKLKRAVSYPYLDFSTSEKRLAACQTEVTLNRRTAPTLYLGARMITRDMAGQLSFDGVGSLVDAVVEMRRFDQMMLFDNMAQRGALTPQIMTDLARCIAAFHRDAASSGTHGGADGIAAVLHINDRSLRATGLVTGEEADAFFALFKQTLERHIALLDMRREAGKVRRCHGDLILRNICLVDGIPTMFDCIEFDDSLATIDILYDLAFLLMDLWHRDQRDHANLVLNRYLDECDEGDGLPLMPFFMAIRAAVRAHVTAAQMASADAKNKPTFEAEARTYFDLACKLLQPEPVSLVAIGGFSGSGKSTVTSLLAASLGPAPGARTLNSDRIRKKLYGVAAETHLPEAAYQASVSEKVYNFLRREARRILDTGHGVVVDAVFDRADEREAIQQVAEQGSVRFHGFWLEAPRETLISRLAARHHDPSDATVEVLAGQRQRAHGDMTWKPIDASSDPAQTRDLIRVSMKLRHADT
ncbi:AAA family ATPase [Microvirga terricola]|uniref:AAA family ATPase n=1 Tax=Microvirga terricola TaxID=2719797 RepID=A0ABX0VFN6_9HYPH|nr:bifunctional aminoglycoside phosphotransferase/ATP-binding protein [Microvirga terricola]NIX78341.1 AAA family ATPase [Microvirga terricola]